MSVPVSLTLWAVVPPTLVPVPRTQPALAYIQLLSTPVSSISSLRTIALIIPVQTGTRAIGHPPGFWDAAKVTLVAMDALLVIYCQPRGVKQRSDSSSCF